jgi:hypothetical protein
MEKYFYKGFEIVPVKGGVKVLAPSLKFKVVKLAKTAIEAKLWIETIETDAELKRAARAIENKF